MTVTRLEVAIRTAAAVRDGTTAAFDELGTRYRPQITAYVRNVATTTRGRRT